MSVWCRQTADGEVQEYVIEPHADASGLELLRRKADGAADKGWAVEWTGPASFTATKDRWGGVLCVREFWSDD